MFLINLKGNESIFTQIKKQIIRFIEIGVLKPNDKLPSVRMLASDLGINPNTVARAYSELESEGIIYTINKKGVFVADKENKSYLYEQAKVALETFKQDGLDKNELKKIIDEIYKEEKVNA